jgi:protein-tyrosine-phosphatase
MAAELFRMRIEKHPMLRHLQVGSAGTDAHGDHAAENAALVLRESYGRDISQHVPAQLGTEHEDADLVLVMEENLVACARRLVPRTTVAALGEFVGIRKNVTDPYRGDRAKYEACARELDALAASLVSKLEQDTSGDP